MDTASDNNRKVPVISLIRLLAMLSIITCHICQYYGSEWAYWLNVGVPVFFIISGFLYGNRQIDESICWLKKRFLKILIPYYMFLTVAIMGYLIATPDVLNWKLILTSYLTVGTIGGIGHLWFVGYILFCYILTPYLAMLRDYLASKSPKESLLIVLGVVFVYALIAMATMAHFRPGMICCYVAGYFTAVFWRRLGNRMLLPSLIVSFLITCVSNGTHVYLQYLYGLKMEGHLVHIVDFSHAALGYTVWLLLTVLFKGVGASDLLASSDKYSYSIYLTHQLFILSPLTLMAVSGSPTFNVGLVLVAVLVSGYALGKADERFSTALRRWRGKDLP